MRSGLTLTVITAIALLGIGFAAGFALARRDQPYLDEASNIRATNDPVDGLDGVAFESVVYVNVGGDVLFL